MSWIFLAIIATFFWASSNIIDKILRTKYLKSSIALTASFGIFGTIFSTILFLFIGIPSIPFQNSIAAFSAGIALCYAIIPYLKALSLEEASRVIPLWHLSPIFTLILAVIFLNEILTLLHYSAFTVILFGGILISTRQIRGVFHLSPAVALMLFSSFLVSVTDVLMKFALSTGVFWETFFIFYLGISLSQLSLFAFPSVRKHFSKAFSRKQNFILILFLSGLMGFIGYTLFNNALLSGPVTLVSVFVSFQSLFVLLLAAFLSSKYPLIIKETIDAKTIGIKLIAIGLMAFGLFLLSF
ncbi:MAG: DMT family transporter [Candidatus Aenigmarchaeota archaeon]|nr:DMT family transporter [Candidatus Aenigmarchaeota archaeon]